MDSYFRDKVGKSYHWMNINIRGRIRGITTQVTFSQFSLYDELVDDFNLLINMFCLRTSVESVSVHIIF